MTSRLIARVALLLAALALSGMAHAAFGDVRVPEELQAFWDRWSDAKDSNDDEDLDKVVRRQDDDAVAMLNTLLDDVSRKEDEELHFECRLLAWSLDRVKRTERHITRVRTVLDMDMRFRAQRLVALNRYDKGFELLETARTKRSDEAWDAAVKEFQAAESGFESAGDAEYRILALFQVAETMRERGWYWDQGQALRQALTLVEAMPYEDGDVQYVKDSLSNVERRGIDLDGPRPEGGALKPAADDAPAPGGTGMTSYAQGAEWQEFQLDFVVPKKGVGKVALPSFAQYDQFQLWQSGYVVENGPDDFDFLRGGRFKPGGKGWQLFRSGIETFEIDSDGDGNSDASFPATSSPIRVDVPVGDGVWPIMVCTLDQRELMFDFEFNYAPTEAGARFRWWLSSWWEGQVLGETWKVYDTDLDGSYGTPWENFDDLVTLYSDDDHVSWFETDGVQLGKAKKAIPFSRLMPLNGGWYRVEPEPDKGTVRVREMNLSTGKLLLDYDVKIMPSHLVVREVGELEGVYLDVIPARKRKPVELPVGTYQISMGRIARGGNTSQDQVRIYTGRSQPFEITAGETTTLELGAPYQLTFATKRDGGDVIVDGRTLRCFGRGGEEYAMFFDEALRPDLAVRTTDGKKVGKPKQMMQCSIGEWERNTGPDNILWFPLEERVTPGPGQTLEFQMTLKNYVLLGGPFESDWIR